MQNWSKQVVLAKVEGRSLRCHALKWIYYVNNDWKGQFSFMNSEKL